MPAGPSGYTDQDVDRALPVPVTPPNLPDVGLLSPILKKIRAALDATAGTLPFAAITGNVSANAALVAEFARYALAGHRHDRTGLDGFGTAAALDVAAVPGAAAGSGVVVTGDDPRFGALTSLADGSVLPRHLAGKTDNLVADPKFELTSGAQLSTVWTVNGPWGLAAITSHADAAFAVQISAGSSPASYLRVFPAEVMPVRPGETFSLTMDARLATGSTPGASTLQLGMSFVDPTGASLGEFAIAATLGSFFVTASGVVTAPAGARLANIFLKRAANTDSVAYRVTNLGCRRQAPLAEAAPGTASRWRGQTSTGAAVDTLYPPLSRQFAGKPSASQKVWMWRFDGPYVLKVGLPGSTFYAFTSAAATSAWTVSKNGSSIGTITFSAGANAPAVSFASDVGFVVGDTLTITAAASVDSTLADFVLQIQLS